MVLKVSEMKEAATRASSIHSLYEDYTLHCNESNTKKYVITSITHT